MEQHIEYRVVLDGKPCEEVTNGSYGAALDHAAWHVKRRHATRTEIESSIVSRTEWTREEPC